MMAAINNRLSNNAETVASYPLMQSMAVHSCVGVASAAAISHQLEMALAALASVKAKCRQ